MTTVDERITHIARLSARLMANPLVPQDARDCIHMLILILGELDTRITNLERVNDGHGRQAR